MSTYPATHPPGQPAKPLLQSTHATTTPRPHPRRPLGKRLPAPLLRPDRRRHRPTDRRPLSLAGPAPTPRPLPNPKRRRQWPWVWLPATRKTESEASNHTHGHWRRRFGTGVGDELRGAAHVFTTQRAQLHHGPPGRTLLSTSSAWPTFYPNAIRDLRQRDSSLYSSPEGAVPGASAPVSPGSRQAPWCAAPPIGAEPRRGPGPAGRQAGRSAGPTVPQTGHQTAQGVHWQGAGPGPGSAARSAASPGRSRPRTRVQSQPAGRNGAAGGDRTRGRTRLGGPSAADRSGCPGGTTAAGP